MANANFTPFQTTLPSGIPNDYEHVDVNADMFGGQSAKALQQVGSDLVSSGEKISSALLARKELSNTLVANDMNTKFVSDAATASEAYFQKKGMDAVTGYADFQKQMLALTQQAIAAAPNLRTKVALSSSTRFYTDRLLMQGRAHADTEQSAWQHQSYTDSSSVKADQFSANVDKGDFGTADDILLSGIDDATHKANLEGIDPAAQAAKYIGATVGQTIQAKIAQGQVAVAERLYSTYKMRMDLSSQLTVDKALKGIHAVDDAQAAAEGRLSLPGAPLPPDERGPSASGPASSGAPITDPTAIQAYIEKAATARGIDPAVALRVWHAEGRNANPNENWQAFSIINGSREQSFGPFQLNVNTFGSSVKAMSAQQNIDTALNYVVNNGWDAWSSKTHTGITGKTGVGPDAKAVAVGAATGGSPADNVYVPESDAQQALNTKYASDPATLIQASQKLHELYSNMRTANAVEIGQLSDNIPTVITSLESGNMEFASGVDEMIQKITTYEPPHAAQMIEDLQGAKRVGGAIAGLKWAPRDQVLAIQEDLNANKGQIADFLASNITDPIEHAKLLTAAQKGIQTFIDQSDAALNGPSADPAKYIASNPAVASGWDIYTKNPSQDTFQKAADASLLIQSQLGVTRPHIFDTRTAQDFVHQVVAPNTDAGATLDKIQSQTGASWPRVFQDLVALGKLPADYAMMQTLEGPDKALMNRALQEQKGNPEKTWDIRLGKTPGGTGDLATTIRNDVVDNADMKTYIGTLKASQASSDEIDQIVHGVQTLAFAKQYYGNDANAAASAVKSYVSRYSFFGDSARIPVEAAPTVEKNAQNLLDNLAGQNIQLPSNIGQVGQPSKEAYINQIKSSSTWVTAPSGDQLWLILPDGTRLKDAGGKPIGVMFGGSKPYTIDLQAPTAEQIQPGTGFPQTAKPSGSLLPSDFHTRHLGDRLGALEAMLG